MSQNVPKLRYRAHALRIDPSPIVQFTKSVKRDNCVVWILEECICLK